MLTQVVFAVFAIGIFFQHYMQTIRTKTTKKSQIFVCIENLREFMVQLAELGLYSSKCQG